MTVTIPAYCPTCRQFFHSNAFGIGGSGSIHLIDCATDCPRGHPAKFLYGSYSVKDNLLSLATGSPETLRIIRELAEKAVAGRIKQEEAVEKIVDLAPSLAPIFQGNKSTLLPYLALLVYLIVELAKAMVSGSQPPTAIHNKNEITIQQPVFQEPERQSKRKARRDRGKAKQEAKRQRGRGASERLGAG
jgi:hypothetical protein